MFYPIRRVLETTAYLMRKVKRESFRNYIPKSHHSRPLAILVNGPSLNHSLTEIIETKKHEEYDLMCVNFMVNDSRFEIIRPRYYVISDPMFYDAPGCEDRVKDFFANINRKVFWKLILFVPYRFWKDKSWLKRFHNNIETIPFYMETPSEIVYFFSRMAKAGIIGTCYGSVLHHAIYAGLLSGYDKIYLYGADHTFFDGLCVNSQNQVCKKTTHFYDENPNIEPIYHTYTGVKTPYTMSHFLNEYFRVFHGHEILQTIAKSMAVDIVNKTPISMIDSYKRTDE